MAYLNVVGVGDCIDYMRQIPDASVDSVVTDAPYGLGKQPDPLEVLAAWLRGEDFVPSGAGFMGKKWDAFVPQPSVWREALRVLKPGGMLISFFGTRTYDWGVMAIRVAGFEVLDQLEWLYGTGMPHGYDMGQSVEKLLTIGQARTPGRKLGKKRTNDFHAGRDVPRVELTTDAARRWSGWNTALKPAHEPVVVARKPMLAKNNAANLLEHGTGSFNVGACRIGSPSEAGSADGRWPANVLLSHGESCERIGSRRVKTGTAVRENLPDEGDSPGRIFSVRKKRGDNYSHADSDGTEEIDEWRCEPGCPVAELDRQSGFSKSASGEQRIVRQTKGGALWHGMGMPGNEHVFVGQGDAGGASRFFWCAKEKNTRRWSYCKRCQLVFTHDRDRFAEHDDHAAEVISHPTQKPLELMEYLVRLVTQPGGVVLDPFCGTGTTALAAKRQGFNYITCDLIPSYAEIARVRLAADSSEQLDALTSGAYICPGCKAQGKLTLIDRAAIDIARDLKRKVACMVCMKRYSIDELGSGG